MEEQKLKDYMLVEIPVYVDWDKFGTKTDAEKQILLKKMSFDMIDKPIINSIDTIEDNDMTEKDRVEGIILKADVVDTNKITAFGLMWITSEPEFQEYISPKTGQPELRVSGISIQYAHELNEHFQKITEKTNRMKKDFNRKFELLNQLEAKS